MTHQPWRLHSLREIDKAYMHSPMPKPTKLDDLYPAPPSVDDLPELRADEMLCRVAKWVAIITGLALAVGAAVVWARLWERAV